MDFGKSGFQPRRVIVVNDGASGAVFVMRDVGWISQGKVEAVGWKFGEFINAVAVNDGIQMRIDKYVHGDFRWLKVREGPPAEVDGPGGSLFRCSDCRQFGDFAVRLVCRFGEGEQVIASEADGAFPLVADAVQPGEGDVVVRAFLAFVFPDGSGNQALLYFGNGFVFFGRHGVSPYRCEC